MPDDFVLHDCDHDLLLRTRAMRNFYVLLPILPLLTGCASTQLNYNTDDVSTNFERVYTNQALNNLSAFIDDENAIPSQIDVSGGTVQTVNTVTPSITFPFTSMVANAVNAGALTRTTTLSGTGATIGATNSAQQNYNVVPVIDGNALRNLQAIYRHAVWSTPLEGRYRTPRIYFNNRFYADPFQISLPQCVLCESESYTGALLENPQLHTNKKLKAGWLLWSTAPGVLNRPLLSGETLHDLGHFGAHELYTTDDDFRAGVVTNFVFFIMPVAQPAETFNAPASSGTQQGGGRQQIQGSAHGRTSTAEGARIIPGETGRTIMLEVPSDILKDDGTLQPMEKGKGAAQSQKPKIRVVIPTNMLAPSQTVILPPQIAPSTNGAVYGPGRDPRRSSVLPGIQP